MKKFFILAASAAALTLMASCQKNNGPEVSVPEAQALREIAVNSVAQTKGYISEAVFYDTAIAQLHEDTPTTTPRVMYLSSYLTPQSGEKANYFVDEPFAINANGETDNKWHHVPKLYWPINGQLDFLAYSSQARLTGTKCVWDEANASSKLILSISEDQSQDDVVYASNFNNSTHDADVAMVFKHSQAWIEFDVKASAADLVTIKSIELKNIYQKGELTILGGASATHSWNFSSFRSADVVVDDEYNVYDAPLTTASQYLDMLIPEQAQTVILIKYVLAGQDTVLEYSYELTGATWQAGSKYIYGITFNPEEIIVAPSVTAFGAADVSGDGFPSELS